MGADVSTDTTGEPSLQWLFRQLDARLFEQDHISTAAELRFRLSMPGWKVYEQLRRRTTSSRTAFMAMDFKNTVLSDILNRCFKPAVAKAGFVLKPINEAQPAGLIDNQIRAAILSGRFVVADLTDDNNGAYFEAGFAEGLGRPVIYTCEAEKFSKKNTHFDTNHMVTIPWDVTQLDEAASKLTATIRWTLPGEAKME